MHNDDRQQRPSSPPKPNADSLFNSWKARGEASMKLEKYGKGVVEFSQALSLKPKDKDVLIMRARCYLLLGNYPKALCDAEQTIAGDPNYVPGLLAVADALYAHEKFEFAHLHYARAMSHSDQKSVDAANGLARCKAAVAKAQIMRNEDQAVNASSALSLKTSSDTSSPPPRISLSSTRLPTFRAGAGKSEETTESKHGSGQSSGLKDHADRQVFRSEQTFLREFSKDKEGSHPMHSLMSRGAAFIDRSARRDRTLAVPKLDLALVSSASDTAATAPLHEPGKENDLSDIAVRKKEAKRPQIVRRFWREGGPLEPVAANLRPTSARIPSSRTPRTSSPKRHDPQPLSTKAAEKPAEACGEARAKQFAKWARIPEDDVVKVRTMLDEYDKEFPAFLRSRSAASTSPLRKGSQVDWMKPVSRRNTVPAVGLAPPAPDQPALSHRNPHPPGDRLNNPTASATDDCGSIRRAVSCDAVGPARAATPSSSTSAYPARPWRNFRLPWRQTEHDSRHTHALLRQPPPRRKQVAGEDRATQHQHYLHDSMLAVQEANDSGNYIAAIAKGKEIMERLRTLAVRHKEEVLCDILLELGAALVYVGRNNDSIMQHWKVLHLSVRCRYKAAYLRALAALGYTYFRAAHLEFAAAFWDKFLNHLAPSDPKLPELCFCIAECYLRLEHFTKCRSYAARALRAAELQEDRDGQMVAHQMLGTAAMRGRMHPEAIVHFEAWLRLARALANEAAHRDAVSHLTAAYLWAGRGPDADALLAQVLLDNSPRKENSSDDDFVGKDEVEDEDELLYGAGAGNTEAEPFAPDLPSVFETCMPHRDEDGIAWDLAALSIPPQPPCDTAHEPHTRHYISSGPSLEDCMRPVTPPPPAADAAGCPVDWAVAHDMLTTDADVMPLRRWCPQPWRFYQVATPLDIKPISGMYRPLCL